MNFIQRFMYGRYGGDQLSLALLLVYFVLGLLRSVTGLRPFAWVGTLLLLWAVYRILSRKIERRRKENARFLAMLNPLARWLRMRHTIRNDKEHCYFKCPNCGRYLRVPRGKGKITVTCRSCGASFEEKS